MPHIWIPMKSNPSPWEPKKDQVTRAVVDSDASLTGFYCKTDEPSQAYVFAQVRDEDHGKRVRNALRPHGTPGTTIYLDDV